MTSWIRAAAIGALVGAVLWIGEVVVLVLSEGQATRVAGWLSLAGWILLLVGSTGVGGALARGADRELQVGAMLLSPILLWLTVLLVGMAGEAVLPDTTPDDLADGFDTGVTALLWASAATWALDHLRDRTRHGRAPTR